MIVYNHRRLWCLLVLGAFAWAGHAAAQGQEPDTYILTMKHARELARARAPGALAARARVDVARGELAGASVWQPFNPRVEVAAGPRFAGDDNRLDLELGLEQRFELGGRRSARMDRARAGVSRARWQAEHRTRALVRDVSIAFVRALHAREALAVARENQRLARELSRVATRRHEVGDVGVLDAHVAAVAHARARTEVQRLAARESAARRRLAALLGIDTGVGVEGDLAQRRQYALDELLAEASRRPELRELAAAREEARAEQRLARSLAWPDVGAFVRYGQKEQAHIIVGGVSVGLPIFERGQGLRATSAARDRALELEQEALRRVVEARVRSAHEVYASLDRAAAELETDAMARVEDSLDLARRSYETGSIAMGELVGLQREMVAARMAYLDVLLEAALAGIELEAAAGVLQ